MGTLSGSWSARTEAERYTEEKLYLRQAGQSFDGFESKALVDVPVGQPVGLVKHCPVRHGVEEGPEGGVAAAVVIQLEVLAVIRSGG